MKHGSLLVNTTLIFILLNAFIWLAFGSIIAANAHPSLSKLPLIKEIMTILSFTTAGMLMGSFFFLRKRSRMVYFLTVILLCAIALLTLFDEFGWVDLVFLMINIIPIILLIKDRRWYLQNNPSA